MRLIDADNVEKEMCGRLKELRMQYGEYDHYTDGFEDAIEYVELSPTIEAEPVRHGRWVEHYSFGAWHYDCPFCDDGYATKERQEKPQNYCHNCGAKMDLEGKE